MATRPCTELNLDGSQCSAVFTREWNLKRHITNVHQKQEDDRALELEKLINILELQDYQFDQYNPYHVEAQKKLVFKTATSLAILHPSPVSTVHCILIPQLSAYQHLSSSQVLSHQPYLDFLTPDINRLVGLVGKELQRRNGKFSELDAPLEAVLNGEVDIPNDQELPQGRDWESSVQVGVRLGRTFERHHIHVMSADLVNALGAKSYNSYSPPSFVAFKELPMKESMLLVRRNHSLERPPKCWRCGEAAQGTYMQFKAHLATEFDGWKRI